MQGVLRIMFNGRKKIQKVTHPWLYADDSVMQCETVLSTHDVNNGIFPGNNVLIEFIKHIYKETIATQSEDSPVQAFLCSLDLQKT